MRLGWTDNIDTTVDACVPMLLLLLFLPLLPLQYVSPVQGGTVEKAEGAACWCFGAVEQRQASVTEVASCIDGLQLRRRVVFEQRVL